MRSRLGALLAAVVAVGFIGISATHAQSLDITGTTVLGGVSPMTYQYDSITIEPGATLQLIGDVTLNVNGNVLINGNIDGSLIGSAAPNGAEGEDGQPTTFAGESGREGEQGNSGHPNSARGIDLTINSAGSVSINGGINLGISGYDGGEGGSGGGGSDGADGASGQTLRLVSGSGGNAGFGGNGNAGGAGGNGGTPGSLIINAANQIFLANTGSLDLSNDSKGGTGGDGGDAGGGGNGGNAIFNTAGNGGNGGGGGAAGTGANGGMGGNGGSVFLFAPIVTLQGNLSLTGGEGGEGGKAGQAGDGGDGGQWGGLTGTTAGNPVGGAGGGGGPGGLGGTGGIGGAGGNLYAIATTISDSANDNFSGGNGGHAGAGSPGGQGGAGGTNGGPDGPGGPGGHDGATGLNGNMGTNVFSLTNTSNFVLTNGNFTNGTFGWRQSGDGTANVINVNLDGFANALQVTTGATGPFAVAQPINTDINGTLGIGFYYLWTTTNGTLVVSLGGQQIGSLNAPATLPTDFTYEYIFLQSNLSLALNQGMADLTLQLLDPPTPAQIEVTDFALTPAPAPEPVSSITLGGAAMAALFNRRRR